jgi:hypothetical protein
MRTETTTLHGRLAAAGTLFLLGLASVTPLAAAPIQLFSLAQLSAAAVVFDYPARAVPNTQPVVPSPYTITGPNNTLTFTEPGEAFVRMDQEPSSPGGGGWFGTFAAGTRLLYTGNTSDADFFGPVTINFANPISEFGLLAQFNDEFFGGPFFFTLFNQATTLGTFSNGVSVLPTFLGARSLDFAITSVLIRGRPSPPLPTISPSARYRRPRCRSRRARCCSDPPSPRACGPGGAPARRPSGEPDRVTAPLRACHRQPTAGNIGAGVAHRHLSFSVAALLVPRACSRDCHRGPR